MVKVGETSFGHKSNRNMIKIKNTKAQQNV